MSEATSLNPYAGNILIAGLGPLRSREEVGINLTELPPYPLRSITQLPAHVVLHYLMELRDLHLPCIEDMRLRETIEMMVRQNYRYMNPKTPQAWATVSGDNPKPKNPSTTIWWVGGGSFWYRQNRGRLTVSEPLPITGYPSQVVPKSSRKPSASGMANCRRTCQR